MTTDIQPGRSGPLVPLSRDDVALIEAQAHAHDLHALMAQAEGLDSDDIPFPIEADGWLDRYIDNRIEDAQLTHEEWLVEEDPWL